MSSEEPPDLDEALEQLARAAVAGEISVEWTEEVELHAPVVGLPEQRTELPPDTEALLRERFGDGPA